VIQFPGIFDNIASRVGFEILASLLVFISLFTAVSGLAPGVFRMSNDGRVNDGCTLLPSLHFANYKNMNKPIAEENPPIKKTAKQMMLKEKINSHQKMG